MNRPPVARVLFGAALLLAGGTLLSLTRVQGLPHPRGLATLVDLSPLVGRPAVFAAGAVFVAAVTAWVVRWRQVPAGVVVVALLAFGAYLHTCQWPGDAGVNNGVALPGAALAAYLVGFVASRRREHVAVEAACGIVAACYSLAALSKLAASGASWATGSNIALHIASQSYAGAPLLQPLRLSLASSPPLCTALGVGTLLIEGSALLFLFPRARPVWAAFAAAMHVGISVLMGLHHYDWLFVTLALAWSSLRFPGAHAHGAG